MKEEDKGFCILPWIHASIGPTGKIYPCCRVMSFSDGFGNLHENSLQEIRNNHHFSDFRKMMLDGQSPLICKGCHLEEASNVVSVRQRFNHTYPQLIEEVRSTLNQNPLVLKYGEIRFSNKCNLACRTCGIEFSSRWHRDHEALYGKSKKVFYSHPDKDAGLINEIEPHLDTIDSLYFVGGEPLIQEAHYKILDMLIEKNRTDVALIYNSNLSRLSLGNQNVLKKWTKFKYVLIEASVDAIHERFSLIRHGEQWETVKRNMLKIKLILPQVLLKIAPTVSVLNVTHLPELIEYCLSKKLVPNISFIKFNFLYDPLYYQINLLPESQRKNLLGKLDKIVDDLAKVHMESAENFKTQVNFIKKSFETPSTQDQLQQFKDITFRLDSLRGENTSAILPELAELLN